MRYRLLLIVAVALLAAVQGALVHPLAHLGEHAHAESPCDGHDREPVAGHSCDLCVAFSALAAAAAGQSSCAADGHAGTIAALDARSPHLPRAPPVFRSQAPPTLS